MVPDSPGQLGTQEDVILPRVGAFVVDHVISVVLAIVLGLGGAILLDSGAFIYVGIALGMFGYFIVLEGLWGRTIGKWLFGLVVVKVDGSPITFTDSLVRNLLRIVDSILNYVVALVVMMSNNDRQRIGDILADTVVVKAQ